MARKFADCATRWMVPTLLIVAIGAMTAAASDGTSTRKPGRLLRGRLPAHYGKVVTEEQRTAIYKIQEEYRPKIEALKAQLEAIEKQRDEKIAAVLTPEQKKQIEQAITQGKEKRAAAKAVETTPSVVPAETPQIEK